jgi:3-hydroxyisobutyrate dehydrogenase
MTTVAFVGLGNMGLPMARNLIGAGHTVIGVDVVARNVEAATAAGAKTAASAGEAAAQADVIFTMLPGAGPVRSVYLDEGGVLARAKPGALLIDSSTIDVETARAVAKAAADKGFEMLDAPVSGGTGGAAAGTLTFMVGGADGAFARAEPLFQAMGKTIVHAGGPGAGQAAKICNNMVLGISMIAVSEAFALADKLGLDRQKLFDISSKSSGQCWSLTSYCPVPGPVPTSPANRDYQPGFAVDLMLKDLKLAQQAAAAVGAATPLGAEAASLYQIFSAAGNGHLDFSGIIKMLQGAR